MQEREVRELQIRPRHLPEADQVDLAAPIKLRIFISQ